MPKAVKCRGEKPVLVTVYVVRPRRRRVLSHVSHHHHHYHHVNRRPSHHPSGGYDRKAELLLYTQQLRSLAQRQLVAATAATKPKNPQHANNKIVPVRLKAQKFKNPTCFPGWERLLLPSFVQRSLARFQEKRERKKKKPSESFGHKMNAIVKSLNVQKKPGFITKLLSTFGKRR